MMTKKNISGLKNHREITIVTENGGREAAVTVIIMIAGVSRAVDIMIAGEEETGVARGGKSRSHMREGGGRGVSHRSLLLLPLR